MVSLDLYLVSRGGQTPIVRQPCSGDSGLTIHLAKGEVMRGELEIWKAHVETRIRGQGAEYHVF